MMKADFFVCFAIWLTVVKAYQSPQTGDTFDASAADSKKSVPEQETALVCVSSCKGVPDGDYQSCISCFVYASCTNGNLIDNRPCAPAFPPLVWDDNLKRCEYESNTCPESTVVNNDEVCWDAKGGGYKVNEHVPSDDECKECTCHGDGNIVCVHRPCPDPLPCRNPIWQQGKCCEIQICQDPVCWDERGEYKVDEDVYSKDPCKECKCHGNGKIVCVNKHKCPPLGCPDPILIPGKCCAVCPIPVCWDKNGHKYQLHENVPSDKPCDSCTCTEKGIKCYTRGCPEPTCKHPFVPENECCPVCKDCIDGYGKVHKADSKVPSYNECEECKCHGNGKITCEPKPCPDFLPCKNPIKKEGNCCEECPDIMELKMNKSNTKKLNQDISYDEICKNGWKPLKNESCGGFAGFKCPENSNCEMPNKHQGGADFLGICCADNVCELPKTKGLCNKHLERYHYNKKAGKCQRFIYSGCGGNGNNFKKLTDCISKCVPVCDLPKVSGRCRASFPRYFYNSTTKTCGKFIYGGCGGNANNFVTLEDCQSTCNVKVCTDKQGTTYQIGDKVPSTEPCKTACFCDKSGTIVCAIVDCAYPTTCKNPKHVKGKCCPVCPKVCTKDGKTYKIGQRVPGRPCKEICSCQASGKVKCHRIAIKCLKPDCKNPIKVEGSCCPVCPSKVCSQPIEKGNCKAILPRYHFDSKSGDCKAFSYGGCGGNLNNFISKKRCETICKKQDCKVVKCGKPKCENSFKPYGKCCKECPDCSKTVCLQRHCENPIWTPGVCCPKCGPTKACVHKGKTYRILDTFKDDCNECTCTENGYVVCTEKVCSLTCKQPKLVGPCRKHMKKYFFNSKHNKCESFYFGGCRGNANNFWSIDECQRKCGVYGR